MPGRLSSAARNPLCPQDRDCLRTALLGPDGLRTALPVLAGEKYALETGYDAKCFPFAVTLACWARIWVYRNHAMLIVAATCRATISMRQHILSTQAVAANMNVIVRSFQPGRKLREEAF